MKRLLAGFLLSITSLAQPALAVELERATNDQLLAEVAFRLRTGGGGGGTATISFSCDSSTKLEVYLIGSTGQESKNSTIFIGSSCADKAAALQNHFSEIAKTRVIAVCGFASVWNDIRMLHRLSATPDGALKYLGEARQDNPEACQKQADSINR